MRLCIINFADGIFLKGQMRLEDSLNQIGFKGEQLFFNSFLPNWPKHEDVPWGFKVYAFEEARKRGFDLVLWIDAAGLAVRPLDPIFRIMEKEGVFLFSRFNASVGEWSSDYALKNLNLRREQAYHIPEISGFCIGINFQHPKGLEFFKQWKRLAEDGITFIGVPKPYTIKDSMLNKNNLLSKDPGVLGHRHDQTAASIIASQLNIPLFKRYIFDFLGEAGKGKSYADYIPLDTVILQNRDIKLKDGIYDMDFYRRLVKKGNLGTFAKTLWKSSIRYLKDFLKWVFIYRRKYVLQ